MSIWKIAGKKKMAAVRTALLALTIFVASVTMAPPIFASDGGDNVIVYDNREKTLKIREISFSGNYTSMSVLVENLVTNAEFRIEHEVNAEDTFNEYMEITATDGMGGVSETVNIENPFYAPEITESAEETETDVQVGTEPVTGSLSVAGSGENGETADTENEAENKPITANEEPAEGNSSFSTSGWASVIDNAESDEKEFFIIRSETGNEFYVMIDREGGNENVYFLNAVTEWDLMGLTQEYEVPNNLDPNGELNAAVSAVSQEPQDGGENQTAQPPEETEGNESSAEQPKSGGIGVFSIIILVLFAGAVGAYFYFFKFRRKNSAESQDGYLPDDYGDGDADGEENTADDDEDDYDDYEDTEDDNKGISVNSEESAKEKPSAPEKSPKSVSEAEPPELPRGKPDNTETGRNTEASQNTEPAEPPDNRDKDVVSSEDGEEFTDGDVGDGYYEDSDDYGGEVDETDVLGGLEGGDEDEDKTI